MDATHTVSPRGHTRSLVQRPTLAGSHERHTQLDLTTSIWLFLSVVGCFISRALGHEIPMDMYIIMYETAPPSTLFSGGKDTEPEPLLCKQTAHLVGLWHLKGAVRIFQRGRVEIVSSCSLSRSSPSLQEPVHTVSKKASAQLPLMRTRQPLPVWTE